MIVDTSAGKVKPFWVILEVGIKVGAGKVVEISVKVAKMGIDVVGRTIIIKINNLS